VSEIIKPSERIGSSHPFVFLTTENISSHGTNKNLRFKLAFSMRKVQCWHFSECTFRKECTIAITTPNKRSHLLKPKEQEAESNVACSSKSVEISIKNSIRHTIRPNKTCATDRIINKQTTFFFP